MTSMRSTSHYFEILPREAAKMDPQQHLLLEVAWEALETGSRRTPCGIRKGLRRGVPE